MCAEEVLSVAVEALQAAINIHSNSPESHGEQLSRCYHSLVQLLMEKEASKEERGQGWNIFNQILDLLDSKMKVSEACGKVIEYR